MNLSMEDEMIEDDKWKMEKDGRWKLVPKLVEFSMEDNDKLTPGQMEKLLQLQDLTGIQDADVCKELLKDKDWNLESAAREQLGIPKTPIARTQRPQQHQGGESLAWWEETAREQLGIPKTPIGRTQRPQHRKKNHQPVNGFTPDRNIRSEQDQAFLETLIQDQEREQKNKDEDEAKKREEAEERNKENQEKVEKERLAQLKIDLADE